MNNKTYCGLILCGGRSLRMGTDKGLVELKNKPLIEHSVEVFSTLFKNIIISSNSSKYKIYNLVVIKDIVENIGPMGGLYSVMKKTNFDYYFVLAVDMPLVGRNFIKTILKSINASDEIVVPTHNQKREPLCAIYSRKTLKKIELQIEKGDYKLQNLLKNCKTHYIESDESIFVNINTMKDINNIRKGHSFG